MKPTKEEAARRVLFTLPQLMEAVAHDMRHAEHTLPMPQFGTLMMLSHHPGTLGDLAERRKVSPPTMSKTIDVLEANGWVERVPDVQDRRKVVITLTDSGRKVVRHAEDKMVELLAGFLEPLEADELETVIAGMDALKRVAELALPQDDTTEEPA